MENILEIFKKISENESITITKLESVIGASKGVLSRAIANKSDIQSKWILKLVENYPQYEPNWLLTGKGSMLKVKKNGLEEPGSVYFMKTDRKIKEQSVPLYNLEASAGVVGLFNNKNVHNEPIDFISIPNLPKCDGAIYVTGDSMYPLLKSGDIIMYKELENKVENIYFGEMYLVSINLDGDEFVTVKWIHKSDEGDEYIKIVSQNSHHGSKDIHISNIKAIALIKASIRVNSMS
jgi:phage repressor protein C with HTH and peptisase S24 domain